MFTLSPIIMVQWKTTLINEGKVTNISTSMIMGGRPKPIGPVCCVSLPHVADGMEDH